MSPEEAAKKQTGELIQRLESSGPAVGNWTSAAFAAFEKWKTSPSLAGKVDTSDFRCFKAGCTITSIADAEMTTTASLEMSKLVQQSWNGPGFRSGPMTASPGKAKTVWIVYRAD